MSSKRIKDYPETLTLNSDCIYPLDYYNAINDYTLKSLKQSVLENFVVITNPVYSTIIYVDTTYGNNGTGTPGDPSKPFATTSAATSAALGLLPTITNQVLIYLRKGTYYSNVDLRDYINYYAEPGVTFSYGTIADLNGACTSNFLGYAKFNTGVYPLRIANASTVTFEFDTIESSGAAILLICTSGYANVTINGNSIYAQTYGTGYVFTIRNNINVTFNIRDRIAGIHSVFDIRLHTGKIIVNTPNIVLTSGNIYGGNYKQAIILYGSTTSSVIIINADLINEHVGYIGGISGMFVYWGSNSGYAELNGNIYGNDTLCVYGGNGSATGVFKHDGSMSSNIVPVVIGSTGTFYFLNGKHISNAVSYAHVVNVFATATVYFKDILFYHSLSNSNIFNLTSNTCFVNIFNCVGSTPGALGEFITNAVPINVKIHNTRSNKPLNVNVTDTLAPSGFILDATIITPTF